MKEYIVISVVLVSVYVLFSYLRTKYLKKNKWNKVVLHSASLLLFFILFAPKFQNSEHPVFSIFRIIFLSFILLYFVHRIYQDIKQLKPQK